MNKLAFVFVAAVSVFGFACKKGGGAAGEALGKVEGFSKQMCECKDKACADKVNDEYTKWGTEMAKTAGAAKDEKPDPDMVKKMTEAATKYTECYTKLAMAGAAAPTEEKKADPAPEEKKADVPTPTAAPTEEPKKEEAKAEEKKDEPKAEEKKPEDKKEGGW